jgi:peptide/nickel transport system permease protein
MTEYLVRRLLLSVVSMFLVACIVFVSVRLMPGDIVDQFFQNTGSSPGQAEALRDRLGLNDPVYVQFGRYLGNLLRLDFGRSLWTDQSIMQMLKTRAPVSVELGLLSLLIGTVVGVPLGVYSAVFRGSVFDYATRIVAILGISVPFFWIAILTVAVPAYYWHWSPPVGYVAFTDSPLDNLKHFLIPSLVLSVFMAGSVMRLMRSTMLEVLRLDYMRTAQAKGLARGVQLRRHALRNALIPVVTLIGLRLAFLLSGSAIIETVYGLPGLGQLTIDAISRRDYQVVQSVTLFAAFIIIAVNLLVDLSYGLIDPRIRVAR